MAQRKGRPSVGCVLEVDKGFGARYSLGNDTAIQIEKEESSFLKRCFASDLFWHIFRFLVVEIIFLAVGSIADRYVFGADFAFHFYYAALPIYSLLGLIPLTLRSLLLLKISKAHAVKVEGLFDIIMAFILTLVVTLYMLEFFGASHEPAGGASNLGNRGYYLRKHIENLVDAKRINGPSSFSTPDKVWDYLVDEFVENLLCQDPDPVTGVCFGVIDNGDRFMWIPPMFIRQKRAKKHQCPNIDIETYCSPELDDFSKDDPENFWEETTPLIMFGDIPIRYNNGTFQNFANETIQHEVKANARIRSYSLGAYSLPLIDPSTPFGGKGLLPKEKIKSVLKNLRENDFIDFQTRLLTFTVLFSSILNELWVETRLNFEFMASTGVIWSSLIVSSGGFESHYDYFPHTGVLNGKELTEDAGPLYGIPFLNPSIGQLLVVFGVAIYILLQEIEEATEKRLKYFSDGWNVIDLSCVVLIYSLVAVQILKMKYSPLGTNIVDSMWASVVAYSWTERELSGLLIFFILIRWIKFASRVSRLGVIASSMVKAGSDLLFFFCIFSMMFLAYALGFWLIAGSYESSFETLPASIYSVFQMIDGNFPISKINPLVTVHAKPEGVFLYLIVILTMVFVVLTMLVAIINDAFQFESIRIKQQSSGAGLETIMNPDLIPWLLNPLREDLTPTHPLQERVSLRIKVIIWGARGLPMKDLITGSADPYVIVWLRNKGEAAAIGNPSKTPTIFDTKNPVWTCEMIFDAIFPADEIPELELLFDVYDEDAVKVNDDFIGSITTPLKIGNPVGGFGHQTHNLTLQLREKLHDNSSLPTGQLMLSYYAHEKPFRSNHASILGEAPNIKDAIEASAKERGTTLMPSNGRLPSNDTLESSVAEDTKEPLNMEALLKELSGLKGRLDKSKSLCDQQLQDLIDKTKYLSAQQNKLDSEFANETAI